MEYWDRWSKELERMAKKETSGDLFMQFKSLKGKTNATDSETMAGIDFATGLSVRAPLLWLVHKLEFDFDLATMMTTPDEHVVQVALSTIAGLTVMPRIGDHGIIGIMDMVCGHGAVGNEGGFTMRSPETIDYLPPIPIAAPNLTIYVRAAPDVAALRSTYHEVRIGFTTAPIEKDAYAEISEVWAAG